MSADDELLLFARAADFAAKKHTGQRRINGDIPYINHPLGVAHILMNEGGVRDGDVLASALLHDTVEDTDTTHAELVAEFGEKIAGIVAEVSDDKTIPKVERKREQIAHAGDISTEARLVKLGDKLYNLRDLASAPPPRWDRERIQGYFCWAFGVIQEMGDVNEALQRKLDELFAGDLVFDGVRHPRLPATTDARRELLKAYYGRMERVRD